MFGLLLCLATLLVWIAGGLTNSELPVANTSSPREDIAWEPVGLPDPLFNGTSAPLKHVISVGTWTPQKASDGSGVLVGGEGSSLSIPLRTPDGRSVNVSVRLNVHVPAESTVAELFIEQVTTNAGIKGTKVMHAVTISEDSARLFPGGDVTSSPSVTETLSRSTPGDVLFRRIQVQRAGSSLVLLLNGLLLVQTSCEIESEYNVRIRSKQGMVSLADMSIIQLVPKSAESK